MLLRLDLVRRDPRAHLPCRLEERRQVEACRLGVAERVVDLEHVGAADHLVDGAEAELGHDGTQLLGDVVEEVDDVLCESWEWSVIISRRQVQHAKRTGLALELGTEFGNLGGDTDRAASGKR